MAAGTETGVLLTTQDADTIGAASDTAVSTGNFGGVFSIASSAFGADGAGTTPVLGYTLSLAVASGSDSGFDSNGVQVNLYDVGGVIVGATSVPATATAASVVFSLAVDSSGVVTLTQRQEIDHALESTTTAPFDDQFAILGTGLVNLTASATITDGDGDTATDSATIDLGGNIRFADDGPTLDVAAGTETGILLTTRTPRPTAPRPRTTRPPPRPTSAACSASPARPSVPTAQARRRCWATR